MPQRPPEHSAAGKRASGQISAPAAGPWRGKAGCAAPPLSGRLAAPSAVLPGTVAENARFLSGRIDEIGLCFFETRACLDYGDSDLPRDLAALPLRWHVHLPADLPWPAGRGADAAPAASLALAVFRKAAFLRPRLAVLHPPEGSPARQRRLLKDFAVRWQAASRAPLLVENIDCCDLARLGCDFLPEHGLGVCLDVGHLLGYAQHSLADSALPEQAALIHWSAPGRRDEHLPLTGFSVAEREAALGIMRRLPATAAHLAEIFHWPGLAASLPVLAALAGTAAEAPEQFQSEIALTSTSRP